MSKTDIEILLKAALGVETVSIGLSAGRENLVFVMGPRAAKLTPNPYARKTLHRLAQGRYLADQQP